MDKLHQTVVQALQQALAGPGEQRLYRGGKLTGLFAGRGGPAGDAAAFALREGLLEVVRTETKGKTTIEWVRLAARGLDFLHAHDSPRAVLADLQATVQATRAGVPVWLDGLRADLNALSARMAGEVQRLLDRLEAIDRRLDEALRRADTGVAVSEGVVAAVPWAAAALTHLDKRKASGSANGCPLPELFEALRTAHPGLTLPDFHAGLRRLRDVRALELTAPATDAGPLPEPEYALLDGAGVLYYYAVR